MGAAEREIAADRPGAPAQDVRLNLTPWLYGRLVDLAFENGYRRPQELLHDMVRLVAILGVSDHIREVVSGSVARDRAGSGF